MLDINVEEQPDREAHASDQCPCLAPNNQIIDSCEASPASPIHSSGILQSVVQAIASARPARTKAKKNSKGAGIRRRAGLKTFTVVVDNVSGLVAEHDEACGDTGATDFMFPERSAFLDDFQLCYGNYVILGDHTKLPVLGRGSAAICINGKNIKVQNALCVPDLRDALYFLR